MAVYQAQMAVRMPKDPPALTTFAPTAMLPLASSK